MARGTRTARMGMIIVKARSWDTKDFVMPVPLADGSSIKEICVNYIFQFSEEMVKKITK